MKRSPKLSLLLLGGLCGGGLAGCLRNQDVPGHQSEQVFANDFQVPGLGYYHAPYRAWFPHPYNYQDPATKLYYHGGLWTRTPNESPVNLSSPTPQALSAYDNASRVVRRGFGSTGSHGHYFFS
jgi:hypothetical protein